MGTNLIDIPEIDDIQVSEVDQMKVSEVVADKGEFAIKMAFIGAGQGGSNIAAKFHSLGYGKVLALNTTDQDLKNLNVPHKYILHGDGGAGKDPEKGLAAIKKYREEVINEIRKCFGTDLEHIMICIGAGGGTGSGTVLELVDLCKDYLKSIGKKDWDQTVGVIVSLPKTNEGAKVNSNAFKVLLNLCRMAASGKLSPLVLMDNARISKLYPNVSVKDFYEIANKNICAHFDIFNRLAAQNSKYATFDVADYRSIIRSGIIMFGHTKIEKFEKELDVSDCIRANLGKGLFCEGVELKSGNIAAGILVASDATLGVLPQTHIDLAFTTLNRLLSDKGATVHRGIYETHKDQLYLYTIVGKLDAPGTRLEELKTAGMVN